MRIERETGYVRDAYLKISRLGINVNSVEATKSDNWEKINLNFIINLNK